GSRGASRRPLGCPLYMLSYKTKQRKTACQCDNYAFRIQTADHRHRRLLRERRERPGDRAAAKQHDEFAAFHCPMPPVLQIERIPTLSYGRRLLRCGILFQDMSLVGQSVIRRCRLNVRIASESGLAANKNGWPRSAISRQSALQCDAGCQSRATDPGRSMETLAQ